MAWGSTSTTGVEDLVRRLAANDPKLTSLHILKHRKFGLQVSAVHEEEEEEGDGRMMRMMMRSGGGE